MKKVLSLLLVLTMVLGMFSASTVFASAASNTKFSVSVTTNKYYTIKNLGSGKMLNVYGSKNANNANITVYQADKTSGQNFMFIKSGSRYVIQPQCSTSRAVNVYGSTAKANSNVCIWNKSGSTTQAWIIEYNSAKSGYIIRSANNTNYVLAATGSKNSSNVCLKKYNPNDNYQVWDSLAFRAVLNRTSSTTSSTAFTMKNYLQVDQSWSGKTYNKGNIRDTGCGILSIVNAVYNLNGKFIEPTTLAKWANQNGLYNKNGSEGSYAGLFSSAAQKYGSTYRFKYVWGGNGKASDARLKNHIASGGTAVVHVYNHFMAIVDYDASTGKFLVFDSAPGSGTSYNSVSRRGLTSPGGDWKTPSQLSTGNLKIDRYYLYSAI